MPTLNRSPVAPDAVARTRCVALAAGLRAACIGIAMLASAAHAADDDTGSRGARLARGFAQIVRDHEEADWQDLASALHLPELTGHPATWSGPFSMAEEPRFTAIYEPAASSLGIEKVIVEWKLDTISRPPGKAVFSQTLTVQVRPDACPTSEEMTAATGSPEMRVDGMGPHGRRYRTRWFDVKDRAGKDKVNAIQYRTQPGCELTATAESAW